MRATARQFAPILMAGMLSTLSAAVAPEDLSLTLLETRLHEIDGQLAQLANYNLGGGVGAIGSRSRGYDTAEQDEWVEIEFGDAVPLDQVVVVPAIRRDGVNGFQADGFPVAFRLRAGASGDRIGKIVGASKVRTAAKSVVKSMSWCRYPGIRPIGGFQDWPRGGQNGTVPKAEPWLIPKSFF